MKSKIVKHEIKSDKANIHIGLIGDIHNFYTSKYFKDILKDINDSHFDLLLIAGDIFNTGKSLETKSLENFQNILKELALKQPIAIILGNHDLHNMSDNGLNNFLALKKIPNVYPLFNTSIDLKINGYNIHIDGYVPNKDAYVTKKNNLKHKIFKDYNIVIKNEIAILKSFKKLNKKNYNILLNHDPRLMKIEAIKNIANEYDLITGGHMHNGYVPTCINFKNIYDYDYLYLFSHFNKDKKGYVRGLIYQNDDHTIFVDLNNSYFYKDNANYIQTTKEKADNLIKTYNLKPLVITTGINKYSGLPFGCYEIVDIKIKSEN